MLILISPSRNTCKNDSSLAESDEDVCCQRGATPPSAPLVCLATAGANTPGAMLPTRTLLSHVPGDSAKNVRGDETSSVGRKVKFACQVSKFWLISDGFVARENHQ